APLELGGRREFSIKLSLTVLWRPARLTACHTTHDSTIATHLFRSTNHSASRLSTVRSSAACSIARLPSRHRRNTFPQITIHYFAFIVACEPSYILEVDEIKTIPCTLASHPFVERLTEAR